MNYKQQLAQFNDLYQAAEKPKNDYPPLPDGKYKVNIDSAEIQEDKNDSTILYLKFCLKVVEGEKRGRLIFKRYNLNNPELFGRIKADIEHIGFEMNNLSDLPDLINLFIDRVGEVTLKTGKPNADGKTFQNCYIGDFEKNDTLDNINLEDLPF